MHLHSDPSLAEVPGFTREQLDALARSVELRRQQLEHGIEAYIRDRQAELRSYGQELLAHHRSMAHEQHPKPADKEASGHAEHAAAPPAASPAQSAPSSPDTRKHEPEEKAKRTKHTRQQKREKELYGLVTPVFLPLLDARDTSPTHTKQRLDDAPPEYATPTRDAERAHENRTPRREDTDMEGGTTPKKSKRTAKKSALRQTNTSRSRRKRVSLVIDGQTVLPADTVIEPALTSPSSEATSVSNSTASLDDMIDPRLTADPHIHAEHYDAVHHSLPLPMSNHLHSPTKPLIETPNSVASDFTTYHPQSTPTLTYNPPAVANRTFLDPSPTHPASLPPTAGPDPIFADDPALEEPAESSFNTYVGGLHGSGTDDVDQAGSYGYPSSLGASYLESYMQSRPLRVRMEAADKAGLDEREKRDMMNAGKKEKHGDDSGDVDMDVDQKEQGGRLVDVDEDMDIMGEMEGFE
ncbi:hypothetical protein CC86DRAFT_375179 [Ophiobolus disseminans]|uniref:Uncharacterized protein n=1 Tax=Ophiobolus disseminans TaxID=1469910 RepID=A0A6A6ZE88_9PLEO|nr:hypothetical protein CC86DRAFT_375179 [Ophiobolus disseminans]